MAGNGLWTGGSRPGSGGRLSRMRRPLSGLVTLVILAGCAHSPAPQQPPERPELAPLLELAKSPEVEIDATDAPDPPRGFSRPDVLVLANTLVDAAERTEAGGAEPPTSERDAVDHTFTALDMRSRRDMTTSSESASRRYEGMSVAWMMADQWERGHRPVGPGRIIKAAWRAESDNGHLGVGLQFVRAYLDARGTPMFVERHITLWNSDPQRMPGTQTYLDLSAGITGVDRCHLVATGRLRPDDDTKRLQAGAEHLGDQLSTRGITESADKDFRRGCD